MTQRYTIPTTETGYITEIRAAIKERTGGECPRFLMLQVRKLAQYMVICDKMSRELESKTVFVIPGIGSNNQPTDKVDPLVAAYDTAQKTINTILTSLGLTFKINAEKMLDTPASNTASDNDPMAQARKNL